MASILPENVLHPYVENAKCDLQDFDEQAEGIGLQEAGTELKELAMNSLRDASTELHMQAGVLTSFKRPEDLVETPDVWACCITKAMMDDVQAERPGEVVVLKGMGMPCCGCLCPTTGAIVQDPDGRVKHVHKQLGCFACCCTCCQGGAENYLEITERPVLEKTISPVHAGNRRKGQLMLALILGLYAVAPASSSGSSSPTSSVSSSGASSSTDTTGTTGQYPSPDETGGAIPISPSRRWHDGYGHSAPPTPATTNAPTNALTNPDDTTGTTGTTVAEFLVGAQGTNVCPDGWVSVGTEAECQSAATTLGYTRQSRVYGYYDDLPKGCFHDAHGDAHFNSHETGAADSAATPICAGSVPTNPPINAPTNAANNAPTNPDDTTSTTGTGGGFASLLKVASMVSASSVSIILIVVIALEISITACVMKGYWRVEIKGVPEVQGFSRPSAPSDVTLTPSGANEILNFLKEDTFVVFQTSKEACEAAVEKLMHKETQQSVPHSNSAVHRM